MAAPSYHGWIHRRHAWGGTDPIPGESFRNIKVFADPNACDGNLPDSVRIVSTGDGKFIFQVDTDEDGYILSYVRAFVSVVGSGTLTVQIRNITQAVDMLSTALTIDSGDFSSLDAATPAVINAANAEVADGDLIAIDVDAAGGGVAEGLGVNIGFRQP